MLNLEELHFTERLESYLSQVKQRHGVDLHNELLTALLQQAQEVAKYLGGVPKGASRAKVTHKLMDEAIAFDKNLEPEAALRISCRKGCGACCYQNVEIDEDEADLLVQMVQEDSMGLDWNKTGCVFLGKDNNCRVYENRPNACRKFFTLTCPEVGEQVTFRQPELLISVFHHFQKTGRLKEMVKSRLEKTTDAS